MLFSKHLSNKVALLCCPWSSQVEEEIMKHYIGEGPGKITAPLSANEVVLSTTSPPAGTTLT
jgi:hypothetical protein